MNIKTIIILPILSLSILALIETIVLHRKENIAFPRNRLMLQNSSINNNNTINKNIDNNIDNNSVISESNIIDKNSVIGISNLDISNVSLSNNKNTSENNNNINTLSLSKSSIQIPNQKIAILDINHFITEDTKQIIRKIGVGKITSYTLTHWKNPVDVCLNALEKMGNDKDYQSPIAFLYKNKRMPHCIVSWQCGECKHEEVKNRLSAYLEKIDQNGFFASVKEKDIVLNILEIALDPTQLDIICRPIQAMIKITEQLKENGYKLYGIANITQDSYEYIAKAHPEIINLFDGLALSYKMHNLKDDRKTFEYLQKNFNINPKNCTLIDKEESTLKTASDFGIENIVSFTNYKQLRHALKKEGML